MTKKLSTFSSDLRYGLKTTKQNLKKKKISSHVSKGVSDSAFEQYNLASLIYIFSL